MTVWVEGHWWYDPASRAFEHVPAGNYEDPGAAITPDMTIAANLVPSLIETAMEQGLLPAKAQSRVEDLKIIHRLLDIMGKG